MHVIPNPTPGHRWLALSITCQNLVTTCRSVCRLNGSIWSVVTFQSRTAWLATSLEKCR